MTFLNTILKNDCVGQYLYQESPHLFAIGRMYYCSPIAGARYYLCLLLTSDRVVPNPLRTQKQLVVYCIQPSKRFASFFT